MELEKDTFNKLIEYLKLHNYPESSIATNYSIGKFNIDLAIIEPDLNIPLSLFEIKSSKNKNTFHFAEKQLQAIVGSLPDPTIPTYLVFPKESEPFFEIERIFSSHRDKTHLEKKEHEVSINYVWNRLSRINKRIESKVDKKEKSVRNLKGICIVLAIITLVLAIVNKFSSLSLSQLDIALWCVATAIFILPYVKKIKVLGLEVENFQRKIKEASRKE